MQDGSRDSKPGCGPRNQTVRRLGPGDDREMLEHPEHWPHWPFLPLKRWRSQRIDTAVVMGTDPLRIARGANIMMLPTNPTNETWPVATVDAILAEGWVVD